MRQTRADDNNSMQIFVLVLVMGLFAAGAFQIDADPRIGGVGLLLALVVPNVLLGMTYWAVCIAARKQLGRAGGMMAMRWTDRLTSFYRWSVLTLYLFGLFHWNTLGYLRQHCGLDRIVLVDELLVMLPPLIMLGWGWWAYYPIDRRLRESVLIRRLDEGAAVHPVWTRGQYILAQFRHHVAMMLVPMLLLVAWQELMQLTIPGDRMFFAFNVQVTLTLMGVGGVFLFAPVIILAMWDTIPLPRGPLRDRLLAMCRQHRVGVRELVLWRTFGGMINGAVMGLIAPLRYILLTDALLDNMPQRQVEAVMAHELAHVRRHHLPWLMLAALVALYAFSAVAALLVEQLPFASWVGLYDPGLGHVLAAPDAGYALAFLLAMVGWVPLFGWLSRRFERQADTFAAQHLSQDEQRDADIPTPPVITAEAANTMSDALRNVAVLNNIPIDRRSWRHGSIAWRIAYLESIIGRRLDQAPIDVLVLRIKIVSLCALLVLLGIELVSGGLLPPLF